MAQLLELDLEELNITIPSTVYTGLIKGIEHKYEELREKK